MLALRGAGHQVHAARRLLQDTGDTADCHVEVSPAPLSPGLPAPWVRLEGVLDYVAANVEETYLLVGAPQPHACSKQRNFSAQPNGTKNRKRTVDGCLVVLDYEGVCVDRGVHSAPANYWTTYPERKGTQPLRTSPQSGCKAAHAQSVPVMSDISRHWVCLLCCMG